MSDESNSTVPVVGKTRQAASKWKSGKGYTLHGSVFGGCTHSQVLALMGEEVPPPPAFMQKLFDAGHESERVAKEWLRSQGVRVKDVEGTTTRADGTCYENQIELKTFFDVPRDSTSVLLSLHLDGILQAGLTFPIHPAYSLPPCQWRGEVWRGEMAILEHKALSPDKFDAFVAGGIPAVSRRYAWQCSAAIVLGRLHLEKKRTPNPTLPLVFSVERRDYDSATRTYSLSGVRAFQLLREPIYDLAAIEDRCVNGVVGNYLDGIVPDCDSEYPCDYAKKDQRSPIECNEHVALAEEYHNHQSDVAYHQAAMLALRPRLWAIATPLGGLAKAGPYVVDARTDKRGREYFSVKKETE